MRLRVITIFKLTNICFNCELIRLMVSKGQIHKELGDFYKDIHNLIELDNELG